MKNDKTLPKFRSRQLVVKQVDDEVLVYDTERHTAFCLNTPARLVMEKCDGKTTLSVAKLAIAQATGSELTDDILWHTLDEFRKADLLEDAGEEPYDSSGVTRRQMLRNAAALGLAIPVISALVAPAAAQAQSCLPFNVPCTPNVPPLCCPGLVCFNIEQGPTGSICLGT